MSEYQDSAKAPSYVDTPLRARGTMSSMWATAASDSSPSTKSGSTPSTPASGKNEPLVDVRTSPPVPVGRSTMSSRWANAPVEEEPPRKGKTKYVPRAPKPMPIVAPLPIKPRPAAPVEVKPVQSAPPRPHPAPHDRSTMGSMWAPVEVVHSEAMVVEEEPAEAEDTPMEEDAQADVPVDEMSVDAELKAPAAADEPSTETVSTPQSPTARSPRISVPDELRKTIPAGSYAAQSNFQGLPEKSGKLYGWDRTTVRGSQRTASWDSAAGGADEGAAERWKSGEAIPVYAPKDRPAFESFKKNKNKRPGRETDSGGADGDETGKSGGRGRGTRGRGGRGRGHGRGGQAALGPNDGGDKDQEGGEEEMKF